MTYYSIVIISVCIGILFTLVAITAVFGYDFVTCPNDNNIYPENTICDRISTEEDDFDNNDSNEATEDEEEAMKKKK